MLKDRPHNEQSSEETEDKHIEFWSSIFKDEHFRTLSELFSLFLPKDIQIRDVSDWYLQKDALRRIVSEACNSEEYKYTVLGWNNHQMARALIKFIDNLNTMDRVMALYPGKFFKIFMFHYESKLLVDRFIDGYGPAVNFIKNFRNPQLLNRLHKSCTGIFDGREEGRACRNENIFPDKWEPFPLIDYSSNMYKKMNESIIRGDYYLMRKYEAVGRLAKELHEMRNETDRLINAYPYTLEEKIRFYDEKDRQWEQWVRKEYSEQWNATRPLTFVLEYLCDHFEHVELKNHGTNVFDRCLQVHLGLILLDYSSLGKFTKKLRHYGHVVNFQKTIVQGEIPTNPKDIEYYITLGFVDYIDLKPEEMRDGEFFKSLGISQLRYIDDMTDYKVAEHAVKQYEKLLNDPKMSGPLQTVCEGLPEVPVFNVFKTTKVHFVKALLIKLQKCLKNVLYSPVEKARVEKALFDLF